MVVLMLSLRTSDTKMSAADIMRRLTKTLGEGGGHRSKAGGAIKLETGSVTEVERIRTILWRRYIRALKIPFSRGQKLVPELGKVDPGKRNAIIRRNTLF